MIEPLDNRAPTRVFLPWIGFWMAIFALGAYCTVLCLSQGLFHTNMNNRFGFGIWIFLDLTVIALGAGAFFSAFLLYILKKQALKDVIGAAVVLGFICYSGAVVVLAIDVGQPLRAWFTFWHPNAHSMLAEVTFCLTLYLLVLAIEYVPLILKNPSLSKNVSLLVFEGQLHKVVVVFAGVGAILSFFHQGSLGGLYGVMNGRPFAFREHFFIWPSTFFLFILSAIAAGPSFLILINKLASKISKKQLVRKEAYDFLGRISGWLLLAYVGLKSVDTIVWINHTAPASGYSASEFFKEASFGTWILFAEIILFGLLPALVLINNRLRKNPLVMIVAPLLVCIGIAINRYVMTLQSQSLPTLPFEEFVLYTPSLVEIGVFGGMLSYGVIVFSLSYRYLPLFPGLQQKAKT